MLLSGLTDEVTQAWAAAIGSEMEGHFSSKNRLRHPSLRRSFLQDTERSSAVGY